MTDMSVFWKEVYMHCGASFAYSLIFYIFFPWEELMKTGMKWNWNESIKAPKFQDQRHCMGIWSGLPLVSLSLSLFLLISLSPPSLLPSLCPSEVERYQIGLVLDSSSGSPLLGCMYLDDVFQNSWSLLSQICSGKRNLCSNQPSSEVQQLKQM